MALKARVLSDLGSGEVGEGKASKGDSQLLKKMTNRTGPGDSDPVEYGPTSLITWYRYVSILKHDA